MTIKTLTGVYSSTYELSAPITTLSVAASGYLGGGLMSAGAGDYTVVNRGGISGGEYGVYLSGDGSVTNLGSIASRKTTVGGAIALKDGGAVTNGGTTTTAALISGYYGVEVDGAVGAITNDGTILAEGKGAVLLKAGGVVINGATNVSTALIEGLAAIDADLVATVHNYGTIASLHGTAAIYLNEGGLLTNGGGSGSALIVAYGVGVAFLGAPGALTNDGTILSTGTAGAAIAIEAGGSIVNGSAADTKALLEGPSGIIGVAVAVDVTNFGTIHAQAETIASYNGVGVYLKAGGNITNGSASDTTATIDGVIGVADLGVGTVRNFGTIGGPLALAGAAEAGGLMVNGSVADTHAVIQGVSIGAYIGGVGSKLINYGTILGKEAVKLTGGGIFENGSSSDTVAVVNGVIGVYSGTISAAVTNLGAIGGEGCLVGVDLLGGGSITNGASNDTHALIQAYLGVGVGGQLGTIRNFGTLLGGGAGVGLTLNGAGAYLDAGGSVTNGSTTVTTAYIHGNVGIYTETIAATVSNFGRIIGSREGVELVGGGRITNGAVNDTSALIQGRDDGVVITTDTGTLSNFGTILSGVIGSTGAYLGQGGTLINGSSADSKAFIQGYVGIQLENGAKATNFGTIIGDSRTYDGVGTGVQMGAGSVLTNEAGALIVATDGVVIDAGDTVINFGTIQASNLAVELAGSTTKLELEGGSTTKGDVVANTGTVDVVSGAAAVSALETSGKVIGAGTLTLIGGYSLFDAGTSLTVARIQVGGSATDVTIATKISDSRIWGQTAGTLSIDSGDQITFTGKGDSFSGTVDGAGTIAWNGGTDTFSAVSLSAAKMTISTAAVTLSNSVNITGTLTATTKSLVVAAGGATLAGGELLLTDNATNSLHGASSSAVLTNDGTIKGAGQVGGGTMSLVNSGLIESAYATALTINTGAKTIVNSGEIEAVGTGGLLVDGAVDNTGTLASSNSTLTVDGAVTGAGLARVFGGKVIFNGAFTENVLFGSSGELVLAHSTGFTGAVSNFSKTGTNSFDLEDISFATATESYSGTSASGVLTVTDGTHTAKIHLTGDYSASTWDLSADSGTGTIVKDPTKTGQAPPAVHAMIAAAASFGAGAASAAPAHGPQPTHADLLTAAHG